MTSTRVIEAQLQAELMAARQRRATLQERWAVARYTASGTDSADDLDVELARVEAQLLELEERLAQATGASPAPAATAPPVAVPAGAPANDVPLPAAEYASTREAAALLGISPRTLEGLRLRGEGPPHIRIGRRVLYPLASLRSSAK